VGQTFQFLSEFSLMCYYSTRGFHVCYSLGKYLTESHCKLSFDVNQSKVMTMHLNSQRYAADVPRVLASGLGEANDVG
jgi:hypothetical protein